MYAQRPARCGRLAVAALAAGFGLFTASAAAQTGAPKFYPGTITPPPQPGTAPPPVKAPPAPAANAATPPKPKLFNTPDSGVRPVSATDVDMPPLPPVGEAGGKLPPPPSVTAERVPAPAGLPTLPSPGGFDKPNTPDAGVPVSTGAAATASAGSPRQAPVVSVEYEMPESVGVGQPLSYSLVVKNAGPSAVSNVRVEHELPTGATFVSSEPAAESAADGRMTWAVGALDAATEKRIKVTMKPTDEGELRGRATVSFSASVEGRVKVTKPRLAVSLSAAEVVRVGDKVVFNIKITNTGSGPANSMTLHARLTDGLSHQAGNVIEAPLANLPAGQTKTLPLEVTAAKAGSQQCTLTVFADANPAETAKANVTLVEPQLVAKQAGPARCWVKAEPTYQIDLSNPGTAATDPLTVWTVVPEGFEFVQATDGGAFAATNRTVVWKLSALAAGSNKSLTVKLRAVGPTDGVVRTIVQSGAEAKGAKPLEAKCETAVKAEGVPALRFEVVDVDDPVEVGKEAVYEIKVTNQGTGACTNVTLVAELGEGTVAGQVSGQTTGRATGNSISFDPIPQLPVKGEAVYKVRVKGTAAGDTRFRVKLVCDQIKTPVTKEENTRFYKE
jgi:uncharacterized repeat protein (TIGR01451 family)